MVSKFRFEDLDLYEALMEEAHTSVVFFANGYLPQFATDLPQTRKVVEINSASKSEDFWVNELETILGDCNRQTAVICIERDRFKSFMFYGLAKIGFKRAMFKRGTSWVTISLLRYSIAPKFWIAVESVRSTISKYSLRFRHAIARRLLNSFAKSLPRSDTGTFIHGGGNCFLSPLPSLGNYADCIPKIRSQLLLFENETLLRSPVAHHEIRERGCGRYQHWEEHVFFSSTDKTDPNSNGRAYRYLHYPWITRILKIFCSPQFLFHHVSFQSAPLKPLKRLREVSAGIIEIDPNGNNTSVFNGASWDLPYYFLYHTRQKLGFSFLKLKRMRRALYARVLNNPNSVPEDFHRSDHIVLLAASLAPGGAERQLCYLASDLKKRGHKVTVVLLALSTPEHRHYLSFLEQRGITVVDASVPRKDFLAQKLLNPEQLPILKFFEGLEEEFTEELWNLYTHLAMLQPSVLHCWLDKPNVLGGVAGWLVGTPKIIISGRNVNPTNFPYLHQEWFRDWYRIVTANSNVTFINNSAYGAKSYAEWLGLPTQKISVVHNGLDVDAIREVSAQDVGSFRTEYGLESDTPVILGVFRLSAEKRPLTFIKAVHEIKKAVPQLRAFIAGVGPMDKDVNAEIERLGLEKTVTLLGRRDDISLLMSAANVVVLTSSQEGLPNVFMEAQWLRRPVVGFEVGGIPEVVRNGITGIVCDPNSTQCFVDGCIKLLSKPDFAKSMGEAGREFIKQEFPLEKMVARTVEHYHIKKVENAPLSDFVQVAS